MAKITFNFYGLTSKSLKKNDIIKMRVKLIENGVTSEKLTEAVCYSSEDVVIENEIKQANFNCNIENLNTSIVYSSFVLDSSDDIKGIPDNDILLNPLLTNSAISKGQLPDYSQKELANNIPAEFNSNSIDSSECSNLGKFKINGIFKSELKDDLNFKVAFKNPENAAASCSLKKGAKDSDGVINCLIDSDINDKIIIDQTTIYDDQKNELIIIGAIESNEKVKCSNGELITVNNKVNVNLSFRQVSQFTSNGGKTTFILNAISSSSVSSGISVKLKAYMINNNIKDEKEVTCSLKSTNSLSNTGKTQADFDCAVDGTCDDIEIISSDDITGINNDLEEIRKSPKRTDEEIKNTENEDELGVGKLYNFNLPHYRDIFPPTLTLDKVESDLCVKHGKLTLTGSFDMDVQKDYDFDLSLSYPSSTIKCTAPRSNASKKVSISCKVQKEFSDSSQFIIEQMIVRKKYKETLFIKSFKSSKSISCSDFNKLNEEKIQKKNKSNYTFIQMNNFKQAPRPTFNLIIHSLEIFDLTKKLIVTVFININRRLRLRVRNLEEIETEAECTPNKQNESTGNVKLDCIVITNDDLSSAEGLNIDSDEISGIPELADPAKTDIAIKEGTVPDYNSEEIFNKELPIISNALIDGENCHDDGTFKIINGNSNEEIIKNNEISNFEIKISNPISSAFCNISSINNKNVNFNCGSKDKFEINSVIIERQFLQKDNNTLFILNSAESKEPFNCIVNSDYKMESIIASIPNNTVAPGDKDPATTIPDENEVKKRYNFFNKSNASSGLSGGAIAAIIIVCCFVVIIMGVLFGLTKSGKILSKKEYVINDNSSVNADIYKP